MLLIQLDAYLREYQGPLDHVITFMMKPYYEFTCPSFSYDDNNVEDSSSGGNNENGDIAIISWDCNDILGTASTADKADDISVNPSFPRIFMIGARDESEDTFQSWQSKLLPSSSSNKNLFQRQKQPHLERIDTLQVSNQFAIAGGALKHHVDNNSSSSLRGQNKFLCRKIKWEQRLFYVYQRVFSDLLIKYPTDDGFIIVEDDAVLLNPNVFAEEACHAHHQKFQFYSLYKSPLQQYTLFSFRRNSSSCTYRHGTVAFYIQRHLMEQIVNEHRRSMFCRFPIDMYISKLGPWYATRREVVGHLFCNLGSVGVDRVWSIVANADHAVHLSDERGRFVKSVGSFLQSK